MSNGQIRSNSPSTAARSRRGRRDHLAGRQPPRHRDPASVLFARARLSRRRQLPRLHGRDRGRARAGRKLHPQARRRHEGEGRHRPRQGLAQDGVRAADLRPARPPGPSRTIPFPSSGTGPTRWGSPTGRFPERARSPAPDRSHPAMAVNLDACIHCNLCVRACREVQVNDVIGMAGRGMQREDRVRFRRPDGRVDLRGLRRMRAGLPDRRADAVHAGRRQQQAHRIPRPPGGLRSARIAASAASSPTTSRTTSCSTSPARKARPTRTGSASKAASASTMCTTSSA